MYFVSACLLGVNCRYDGKSKPCQAVIDFLKDKDYQPICPECLGGLAIPHPPAELCGGDGEEVWAGFASVRNAEGEDVTAFFLRGAQQVLQLAQQHQVDGIILKKNSPSCGTAHIYDGSFSGTLVPGLGVTAALLRQAGYCLFDEENLPKVVDE